MQPDPQDKQAAALQNGLDVDAWYECERSHRGLHQVKGNYARLKAAATNSKATAKRRLLGSMKLNRPLQSRLRRAGETPALRGLFLGFVMLGFGAWMIGKLDGFAGRGA